MHPAILIAIGVWFMIIGRAGIKRGFFFGFIGRTQIIPWLTGEEKKPIPNYNSKSLVKKSYKKADKIYNSIFIAVGGILIIAGLIGTLLGVRL